LIYSATPLLGRIGLDESPTTAIVRLERRISAMFAIGNLKKFAETLYFGGR